MRVSRWIAGVVLLTLAAAGCGSEHNTIDVGDPWARPTAPGADSAAFYVTFTNDTGADDLLTDGYSTSCEEIQVHNTTLTDGVMSMAPASAADLFIANDASLNLEPGGLHVMCVGPREPLVEGETVQLELTFDKSGVITFDVPIEQREG